MFKCTHSLTSPLACLGSVKLGNHLELCSRQMEMKTCMCTFGVIKQSYVEKVPLKHERHIKMKSWTSAVVLHSFIIS